MKRFQVSFTLSWLRGRLTPTLAPEFSSFPEDLAPRNESKTCTEHFCVLRLQERQERRRNRRILELLSLEKIPEHPRAAPHIQGAPGNRENFQEN